MKLTVKFKPSQFPRTITYGALGSKFEEYELAFSIVSFCLKQGDKWIAFSVFRMSNYCCLPVPVTQSRLESLRDTYGVLRSDDAGRFQVNSAFIRRLANIESPKQENVLGPITGAEWAELMTIISDPNLDLALA